MRQKDLTFDTDVFRYQYPVPPWTRIDMQFDEVLQTIVATVERRIAAKGCGRIHVPKTWWDAVKERFAPFWFLRRWPCRYTVYDVRAWLPQVNLPKDHKGPVHMGFLERMEELVFPNTSRTDEA